MCLSKIKSYICWEVAICLFRLCLPLHHSEMLVTALSWFQIQRGNQKISRGSEDEYGFEVSPWKITIYVSQKSTLLAVTWKTKLLKLFPFGKHRQHILQVTRFVSEQFFQQLSDMCHQGNTVHLPYHSSEANSLKLGHQFKHNLGLKWLKPAIAWHLRSSSTETRQ